MAKPKNRRKIIIFSAIGVVLVALALVWSSSLQLGKMLANKDVLLEKIQNSGVKATLDSFSTEMKKDGLHVDYMITTSDISALSKSRVPQSKLRIMRNDQGDWFCRPILDKRKKLETQEEQAKFDDVMKSAQFKSLPKDAQSTMASAVTDFRAEISVTLPDKITEAKGLFKKKDDHTVSAVIDMDLVKDPQTFANVTQMKDKALLRTGKGPVPTDFFKPISDEEDVKTSPGSPAVHKVGDPVKIILRNGTVVEGKYLELGKDYIKIEFQGVPVTYYANEIKDIK